MFWSYQSFVLKPSRTKVILDIPHTATRQEGHQERPDELISIDSNDFSGRPQGAQDADYPRDVFLVFGPYTPPVKYIPGGPHLPQINLIN